MAIKKARTSAASSFSSEEMMVKIPDYRAATWYRAGLSAGYAGMNKLLEINPKERVAKIHEQQYTTRSSAQTCLTQEESGNQKGGERP